MKTAICALILRPKPWEQTKQQPKPKTPEHMSAEALCEGGTTQPKPSETKPLRTTAAKKIQI